MEAPWLTVFCLVFATARAVDQFPPEIPGSFIARGELVQASPEDPGRVIQLVFEENYDASSGTASFEAFQQGTGALLYHNNKRNETLSVFEDGSCVSVDFDSWKIGGIAPNLNLVENNHGEVYFPVKQMFLLDKQFVVNKSKDGVLYRDLAADMYVYKFEEEFRKENVKCIYDVKSYWSRSEMVTTSKTSMPLGMHVHQTYAFINNGTMINQTYVGTVNLFYFMNDTFNRLHIQFPQGVYCEDRKPSEPFPSFAAYDVYSYHSEFSLVQTKEFRSVDIWMDSRNGFLRVDFDSLYNEHSNPFVKGQPATTIIVSAKQNALYQIDHASGATCKIMSPDEFQTDPQLLVNVSDSSKWNSDEMMGSSEANYRYMHTTLKRGGVPCNLFQGKRKFSELDKFYDSIWEWCLANVTRFGQEQYVPFTLDIKLIGNKNVPNILPDYSHQIYHFKREDPNVLDATHFDISSCFPSKLRLTLEFQLDINMDRIKDAEDIIYDIDFLASSKQSIYNSTKLSPNSLRIGKLKMKDYATTEIFLQFLILDEHPHLPREAKKDEIPLVQAVHNLNDSISSGSFQIFWGRAGEEPRHYRAVNNSLRNVVTVHDRPTSSPDITDKTAPIKDITTAPYLKSTSADDKDRTTSSEKGKSTKDDKDKTSPIDKDKSTTEDNKGKTTPPKDQTTPPKDQTTPPKDQTDAYSSTTTSPDVNISGYSPGSLGGLAVGMLLIGVSLGAGGTFAKFRFFSS